MSPFDPEKLLREDLRDFPPYSMGHVPLVDLDKYIKLDLNENSFGPSPKAIAALAEMPHYHRYVGQEELREAIARYVGVDASHIVTSNGADEMIDLVQRVFLNRVDAIVDCPPSFEMYGFFARMNGARIVSIPRRDDFSVDVDGIERSFADGEWQMANGETHQSPISNLQSPKLCFLANPNNPDGSMLPPADVERLLALPAMLVLDEAYAEFAGESSATRVPTQSNLIVLRTFSKWAGLASLRVGYCIAPKPIAAKLLQCKSPENVNAAGNVAARASLDDLDYLMGNVRRIVAERERMSVALAQLGFLQPLPSRANFILCRVVGHDAKKICDALARCNILIRAFGAPRLREFIRIAVGTPEQNEVLLRALKEWDADKTNLATVRNLRKDGTIILIKHALPELNPTVPAAEWHLSERGRARSELLANKLDAYSLDVIVSSAEPKAIETAQIVAKRLGKPHEVAEGLHEHDRRNVSFMPLEQLEAKVVQFFGKPNELVFGNETANEAYARFADAIARVIATHPQRNIAVVAHGTVISLFVAHKNEMRFEFWKRLGLPSMVVLSLPDFQVEEVIENVE